MSLYTGGTFDLFHWGHQNFLRQCKLISTRVIVSLNTDEFVKKYKSEPPIMTFSERKKALENCEYVDQVIENICGYDSKPAILSVKPHILAIGSDWACRDYYKQMNFTQEWLESRGIVLVYIPYTEGVSSTEIKKRILERGEK
jgi:glycerol-3-phosphate cytidylyltransferase